MTSMFHRTPTSDQHSASDRKFSIITLSIISVLFLTSCTNTPDATKPSTIDSKPEVVTQVSEIKKAWILALQNDFTQAEKILKPYNSKVTLNPPETASAQTLQDSVYFAWTQALMAEHKGSLLPKSTITSASHTTTDLTFLSTPSIQPNIDTLTDTEQTDFWLYKAHLLTKYSHIIEAIKARVYIEHLYISTGNPGDQNFLNNQDALWTLLSQLNDADVQSLRNESPSSLQSWLALTQLTLHSHLSLNQQIAAIDLWQLKNSAHPGALVPPADIGLIRNALRARPVKLAIILPMHGKYRSVGKAIRDGILNNYYLSDYKPSLSFYSASETDDFLATYQAAVDDGADWIIGPLLKAQLEALYRLKELPVRTLALNKLHLDKPAPNNLIEYSLSSFNEIDSLIPLMEKQGANRTIILAQKANWSNDTSQYFSQQWEANQHELLGSYFFSDSRSQSPAVQQALQIDLSKKRIQKVKWLLGSDIETHERRRQDIDSILILSKPQQAVSLRPLLAFYYASNLGMYATSHIYRGYPLKTADTDLRGIQFTDTPLTIKSAQQPIPYYAKSPFIRMFGLGLDSFSITERYSLLSQLDNSQFYGATGVIGVKQNTLSRKTDYAYFKSGEVFPLMLETEGQKTNSPHKKH